MIQNHSQVLIPELEPARNGALHRCLACWSQGTKGTSTLFGAFALRSGCSLNYWTKSCDTTPLIPSPVKGIVRHNLSHPLGFITRAPLHALYCKEREQHTAISSSVLSQHSRRLSSISTANLSIYVCTTIHNREMLQGNKHYCRVEKQRGPWCCTAMVQLQHHCVVITGWSQIWHKALHNLPRRKWASSQATSVHAVSKTSTKMIHTENKTNLQVSTWRARKNFALKRVSLMLTE